MGSRRCPGRDPNPDPDPNPNLHPCRAMWVVDAAQGAGLRAFFDRLDLLEINEEVRGSSRGGAALPLAP